MKKRSSIAIGARLIGLVRPLLGYMIAAVTMGLVGHLCAALITVLGGYALLDVAGLSVPVGMHAAFWCCCIFAVLRGVLRYGEQACNHFIAFKLLALIRDKVFLALRRLCPAKLEGRDKGDLIAVITADIELLEVFYAHTISPIAIALLMSVLFSVFIGLYHWVLGVAAAVAYLLVGVLVPLYIARRGGRDGAAFRTQSGALSSYVLGSLRGLSEIMQYAAGSRRLEQMEVKTDDLAQVEQRMRQNTGRNTALTNTVILLADIGMLFLAAWMYQTGRLGFDGALIATIALMSSFGPVIALANLGSTLQNTFAAADRVLDILDEQPVAEEITGQPKTTFSGASVQDLTFSYGDETILQNMSLALRPGTVTGIVGRSGSGKSTLLKLLMRFWPAAPGSVQVSGRDIGAVNTADLRQMESYVTQQTHLFSGSIGDNLRIARLDATQQEIEEACKRASVHDFIAALPQGYDTPVGELGSTLSGGERQRIGLARAFLHGAPLLLLDEPTSNLDSLNEAVILKSLAQERGQKTVVLVSHRQSTMRIADTVYSVENGRMS